MMDLSREELDRYLKDLTKRRQKAHDMDLRNETSFRLFLRTVRYFMIAKAREIVYSIARMLVVVGTIFGVPMVIFVCIYAIGYMAKRFSPSLCHPFLSNPPTIIEMDCGFGIYFTFVVSVVIAISVMYLPNLFIGWIKSNWQEAKRKAGWR